VGGIRPVATGLVFALLLATLVSQPAAAETAGGEAAVVAKPAARRADIPMTHIWQSINNCGPASVSMILSSMGLRVPQEEARLALRGTDELRGMGPSPVDPWTTQRFGIHAFWRNGGTPDLLKVLISNGFAPMVTQWLYEPPSRIAHWRVVRGYDDGAKAWYVADPMRGAAVPLSYQWFESNWRPFQFRYLVLYRPEQTALLKAIVGNDWHDVPSRLNYLGRAKQEALDIGDSEAWLSYGEAAYLVGRAEESVAAFEKGMLLGSPTGISTVRTSYPNALRLLGREADARRAQARLSTQASRTVTAISASPSGAEIKVIAAAGGDASLIDPELHQAVNPPAARVPADPVRLY